MMDINRRKIEEEFTRYAENYDLNDPKIRLKYEHTFRVAENCERIARSISMPEEDIDIAWALGMFHDIGRFEQVRRYHTFLDAQSVNHAALSADLLFRENLADRFLDTGDAGPDEAQRIHEAQERKMMEQAIRLHNVYRLPEALSGRSRQMAEILRDADRIDILRVNCETPRTEIYNLPEEEFEQSDLTSEVYQNLCDHQMVDRKYSKTGIDFLMGHVAFVFGLEFPESRVIVREQGYLEQILSFRSKNTVTEEKLQQIRSMVHAYLEK